MEEAEVTTEPSPNVATILWGNNIDKVADIKTEPIINHNQFNKFEYRETSWCPTNEIVSVKLEPVENTIVKSEGDDDDDDDLFDEFESRFAGHSKECLIKHEELDLQDLGFKTETKNLGEQENNNQIGQFSCRYCDYKTSCGKYFEIHTALHEDPSKLKWYYCTICQYKTRQMGHLNRHYKIHQEVSQSTMMFTCAICESSFKQKCTLVQHIQEVHAGRKIKHRNKLPNLGHTSYSCDKCSYTSHKKHHLICHLDKHKDPKDITSLYICDICSFKTKYRRNLRVHLQIHKEDDSLKVYLCKICEFKTRLGNRLKRHLSSKKHLGMVGKLSDYRPRGDGVKKRKT